MGGNSVFVHGDIGETVTCEAAVAAAASAFGGQDGVINFPASWTPSFQATNLFAKDSAPRVRTDSRSDGGALEQGV
jgi:hypothetical protein